MLKSPCIPTAPKQNPQFKLYISTITTTTAPPYAPHVFVVFVASRISKNYTTWNCNFKHHIFTTHHIVILRPHTSSFYDPTHRHFTTPHIVILRPTTSTLFFLENLHYDPPHRHFTTPYIVILRPHTSSFYDPTHRHFTTPCIVILLV